MSKSPGRLSPRQRISLALALTAVAGSVDAIGYVVLFHVFTANMTGNTVGIGLGLVQHDWWLLARRGFAVPMFLVGMLWSRFAVHVGRMRRWRHTAALLFGSEAALLAAFAVLGLILVPEGRVETEASILYFVLIGLLTLAMGIQNASLSHFGPLSVRTTHVTGNLATLADRIAKFGIWFHESSGRNGLRRTLAASSAQLSFHEALFLAAVWFSYLGGAIIGAALLAYWGLGAVIPGVAVLISVAVVDWNEPILARRNASKREPSSA
jgi:uncharacterized membrane protein YoaK (UPF0700 family)